MQIIWSRLNSSTDKTDRRTLVAYANFNSNNRKANFNANNPDNENDNIRGRASEQVYSFNRKTICLNGWFSAGYELCRDLIHPPSILPISESCA